MSYMVALISVLAVEVALSVFRIQTDFQRRCAPWSVTIDFDGIKSREHFAQGVQDQTRR